MGRPTDADASQWLRSRARRLRWDVSAARRGLRGNRRWHWPAEAGAARDAYQSRLGELVDGGIECGGSIPLEVFSFSSQDHLPEQVASLRSFLTHAGAPVSWTVVSDGSHTRAARELLEGIHPCVVVADWRARSRPGLPRVLWDYARADRMGKKLMALVSLPGDRPVLYTDADVLYFTAAGKAGELAGGAEDGPRYIRDTELRRSGPLAGELALDPHLLRDDGEGREEVNSGFILLDGPLDWMPALRRLERLRWKPTMFTEQTVAHLTLREAGCRPLDPSRYILAADDRWQAGDPYLKPQTVLRHYVTPVRHKFWIALSRYGSAV